MINKTAAKLHWSLNCLWNRETDILQPSIISLFKISIICLWLKVTI